MAFTHTDAYQIPNVSRCIAEEHVHYNPQNADWYDPEFKRIALAAFNDGHEMTYEELAAITQEQWNTAVYTYSGGHAQNSIFKNNALIETIADMEKFTGVTVLDDHTFFGCTGVTGDLVVPSNISGLKAYVFSNMTGVTSIIIDHDVDFAGADTDWGPETFGGLTGLSGLIDLRHLKSIGSYHEFGRFGKNGSGCQVLMPALSQQFGVWFIGTKINAMAGSEEDLVSGTIKIPDGYTHGGQEAFNSSTGFTRIICPESMTTFDSFSGGDESWNNVRYFEMGSNTTELKGAVCAANGYTGTGTVVVCKSATPPTMKQGGIGQGGNSNYAYPFISTRVSALYVPDESVELYKQSSTIVDTAPVEYDYYRTLTQDVEIGWKRFAGVIRPLSELT